MYKNNIILYVNIISCLKFYVARNCTLFFFFLLLTFKILWFKFKYIYIHDYYIVRTFCTKIKFINKFVITHVWLKVIIYLFIYAHIIITKSIH